MDKSIALMIQRFARAIPEHTALIVGGERYSYALLASNCRRTALYFSGKGVKPGDRVIVEADHTPVYMYLCYGIQLLGAAFVPLEKGSPSARIAEIAGLLDASAVVTVTVHEDLPGSLAADAILADILALDDSFLPAEPADDDLAEILFTTGTTGKSKGVMVTFKNQVNIALAGIETTNIKPDNVWLIPTPMNHAAGLRKAHIAMAVGSTVVLLEGFRNFKQYFQTIHDCGVTSLYLPPSAIHLMLTVASKNFAELNGQLRFIYSSSTAYPETDKQKMRALMPDVYMYNAYGSSEVGVVCTDEFCVSGGSAYPGSVGKPNSHSRIVLLDEAGHEIANATAQNPGFAAIASDSVMKGYWNEPELTASTIRNGMMVMSDLCYFSPDGELILVGRSNDTINLGGLKVAPAEVEEVVLRAECVDECLMIPVTHGGNTTLKLLVVLKEGMELDEEAIRSVIRSSLEPYKMPRQIAVIDAIERTFNGKIDRKKMIAKYA